MQQREKKNKGLTPEELKILFDATRSYRDSYVDDPNDEDDDAECCSAGCFE